MAKIKRIIAREGLIVSGLAVVLYLLIRILLQNVPVVLPKYRLEFSSGEVYTITINPEIRNDSNYKKLLEETYNPSPKLIEKRIKEFTRTREVKSTLKNSTCINANQVYISQLYSRFLGILFILKLAVIYLVLLFLRFIFWSFRMLKK